MAHVTRPESFFSPRGPDARARASGKSAVALAWMVFRGRRPAPEWFSRGSRAVTSDSRGMPIRDRKWVCWCVAQALRTYDHRSLRRVEDGLSLAKEGDRRHQGR
jgi:hypothetical protein